MTRESYHNGPISQAGVSTTDLSRPLGAGWDGGWEDFENCRRSARLQRALGPWARGPRARGPRARGPRAHGPRARGPGSGVDPDPGPGLGPGPESESRRRARALGPNLKIQKAVNIS